MIWTVTTGILKFGPGVQNFYFLKQPDILVTDMNLLQAAVYDKMNVTESSLTVFVLKCWQ